jgi:hypothetical protein
LIYSYNLFEYQSTMRAFRAPLLRSLRASFRMAPFRPLQRKLLTTPRTTLLTAPHRYFQSSPERENKRIEAPKYVKKERAPLEKAVLVVVGVAAFPFAAATLIFFLFLFIELWKWLVLALWHLIQSYFQ